MSRSVSILRVCVCVCVCVQERRTRAKWTTTSSRRRMYVIVNVSPVNHIASFITQLHPYMYIAVYIHLYCPMHGGEWCVEEDKEMGRESEWAS